MKEEKTTVKDSAGNFMGKYTMDVNMEFTCECGKKIKKGDNLYQFHYTEPICEECFQKLLNN